MGADRAARREVVAVAGKGGVGKTTSVALMAKLLSRQPLSLLVVDADPPVSLAYALGVDPERSIGALRARLIEDPAEKRRIGDKHMREVIAEEALIDLDGISLLVLGRAEGPGCYCGINELLKYGIESLAARFDVTLIDCEAGLEQINRRVLSSVTTLLLVSDATVKGLRTATRLREIAGAYGVPAPGRIALVLNRVGEGVEQLEARAREIGLDLIGIIPDDPQVAEYDRLGRPTLTLPDNSPSVAAVHRILATLDLVPR